MILIFTSLKQEATPIIDELNLKFYNSKFPTYMNDKYCLIITGVGKYNMCAAIGFAFGKFRDIEGALNIGCSGSFCNEICIGSICIGNLICAENESKIYIPDILYNHDFIECSIKSFDTVVKNNLTLNCNMIADMEAFSFMCAASKFLTIDKIAVLKVVSDYTNNNIVPKSDDIISLFKMKVNNICSFINVFSTYCISYNKQLIECDNITNKISEKYRLTTSQKNILKKCIYNSLIYYNTIPNIDLLPQVNGCEKKNTAVAFAQLINNIKNNINCIDSKRVLTNVKCSSENKFFSHIYVEKEMIKTEFANNIIKHFPNAIIVEIPHYKDVFNRGKQDIVKQSNCKNLIIAKPSGNLIYKGSDYCNAFGFEKFYYCSTIMGCPYNCEYCYLQGLYPTSNIAVFEPDKYFDAINAIDDGTPALICCSYDSDILALDGLIHTIERWLEFAKTKPHITFEIRTKCSSLSSFNICPLSNVIIAFTLSPNFVCKEYEITAPPLKNRMLAAERLVDAGWRVRLCIEPVLVPIVDINEYNSLVDIIIESTKKHTYEDIVVGSFRMNKNYFNLIASRLPESKIFNNPFIYETNSISYENSNTATIEIANKLRLNTNTNILCFDE